MPMKNEAVSTTSVFIILAHRTLGFQSLTAIPLLSACLSVHVCMRSPKEGGYLLVYPVFTMRGATISINVLTLQCVPFLHQCKLWIRRTAGYGAVDVLQSFEL